METMLLSSSDAHHSSSSLLVFSPPGPGPAQLGQEGGELTCSFAVGTALT